AGESGPRSVERSVDVGPSTGDGPATKARTTPTSSAVPLATAAARSRPAPSTSPVTGGAAPTSATGTRPPAHGAGSPCRTANTGPPRVANPAVNNAIGVRHHQATTVPASIKGTARVTFSCTNHQPDPASSATVPRRTTVATDASTSSRRRRV